MIQIDCSAFVMCKAMLSLSFHGMKYPPPHAFLTLFMALYFLGLRFNTMDNVECNPFMHFLETETTFSVNMRKNPHNIE